LANPFEKRATEYLRDDNAFLEAVTPDPLFSFFNRYANEGRLYDRLVKVLGTPGSGKTTIAMLIEFAKMHLVCRDPEHDSYKPIIQAMSECGLVTDGKPSVVSCRLPMESEYRDYWELPYEFSLRQGLVKALIQARAVISWIRSIREAYDIDLDAIEIIPRNGVEAAFLNIGGHKCTAVWNTAVNVERDVYDVGARLVPPNVNEIGEHATGAYWPFEVIDKIVVRNPDGRTSNPISLTPLAILDDAHTLHAEQIKDLEAWLTRREMRVGRWVMTRHDNEAFKDLVSASSDSGEDAPLNLVDTQREITIIRMQGGGRKEQKSQFKKMARSMADRKLSQYETFNRRNIHHLRDILTEEPPLLSASRLDGLRSDVEKLRIKLNISKERRDLFWDEIDEYFRSSRNNDSGEDVRLSLLRILLYRYADRVKQKDFFDGPLEGEPNRAIKIKADIVDGARFHLLHEFGRPKFYGIDALSDGSSQNAELFLRLASPLVSLAETRLIKGYNAQLDATIQNEILRKQARKIIDGWSFPESRWVRMLVKGIADECVEGTLSPTAKLADGYNAYGIPQAKFDAIADEHPELASILKFGVAYNAISLVSNYPVKHEKWCLVELGGIAGLAYGLTFSRGNFFERSVDDLLRLVGRGG